MTVRSVLEAQVAAWNRGDVDAFCASCAPDVVHLRAAGPVVGRDAVAASYRARYPDRAAMGTLAVDVLTLEEVGDAALVVVRWSVARSGDHVDGHALLGFRRAPGGWELAYDATV